MWVSISMTIKTENGMHVAARQRVHRDTEIPVKGMTITVGTTGELVLACSVGDERGMFVVTSITLDELLAWLPEMTAKAQKFSASKAEQRLVEALRQEGILVTTSPRLKVTNPCRP